jgi:hypothetical protein
MLLMYRHGPLYHLLLHYLGGHHGWCSSHAHANIGLVIPCWHVWHLIATVDAGTAGCHCIVM